jgi:hypothetical protein
MCMEREGGKVAEVSSAASTSCVRSKRARHTPRPSASWCRLQLVYEVMRIIVFSRHRVAAVLTVLAA